MNNPQSFYTQQKQLLEEEIPKFKQKLFALSMLRLGVFVVLLVGVYYFFSNSTILIPFVVLGMMFFAWLLVKYSYSKNQLKKKQLLLQINTTELAVLNGNYSELDAGKEYIDPKHSFSYDIDLFGEGSFFQYINRTALSSGKNNLAQRITSNDTRQMLDKQEAVKELAQLPEWRQNFQATAQMIKVETSPKSILHWLYSHASFVPKSMRFLPLLFSLVSVLLIVLFYVEIISGKVMLAWGITGLVITGVFIKKINQFYGQVNKAKDTFRQYHQLLQLIETQSFSASILLQKQQEIKTETQQASQIFHTFSKMLDAFDQRNNMLVGVIANALALRDLQLCYKLEQWMLMYQNKIEHWFEVVAFFDAQNSLANFWFNHPQFVFPTLNKDNLVIQSSKLGHPLLPESKRIDNDFFIQNEEFFIITGANMAGKSTFLRTVSLAIVMANTGLPVCAKNFDYNPIKLITSMRASDSLAQDESYFFSELKRLQFVVESIASDRYFVILDEILKGTNSTDKAIGSQKFVEKLVTSHSTGIIATHDLSLCQTAETLPQVKNYFFDAQIVNDELYFDYTLKTGVCKNMNASFLLTKMGIV